MITSATSCQINWFKLTYLLAHKARILYSPFHLVLGKHCRRPRQQELFSFEFGLLFLDLVLKKIIRILFFSFRLNFRIKDHNIFRIGRIGVNHSYHCIDIWLLSLPQWSATRPIHPIRSLLL